MTRVKIGLQVKGLTCVAFVVLVVFSALNRVDSGLGGDQLTLTDHSFCDVAVQRGHVEPQSQPTHRQSEQKQGHGPPGRPPRRSLPQSISPEQTQRGPKAMTSF